MSGTPAPALPPSRWFEHKLPPPLIDASAAALMWGLARLCPQAQLWPAGWDSDASPWLWAASATLAGVGIGVALAGLRAFTQARTTVNPLAPGRARTLVTQGIYRHTRNPMYLGMALLLLAWALWLGNAAAWPGLPLFVLVMQWLQIGPEERLLHARFGADYQRYAAQTRRWL